MNRMADEDDDTSQKIKGFGSDDDSFLCAYAKSIKCTSFLFFVFSLGELKEVLRLWSDNIPASGTHLLCHGHYFDDHSMAYFRHSLLYRNRGHQMVIRPLGLHHRSHSRIPK